MENKYSNRKLIISAFIILILFIFIARLFYLQVPDNHYKLSAENNATRHMTQYPSRGLIFDRTGCIIVENRPSYSLFIIPHEYKKDRLNAMVTASVIGMTQHEIEEKIKDSGRGPFTPVRLSRDMDFKLLSAIEEDRFDLPGIFYQVESVRTYPSAAQVSHTIGYLGEINKTDLFSMLVL